MFSDTLKALIQYLLPKKAMTAFGGYLAELQIPVVKNYLIRYFIQKYNINMSEAVDDNINNYINFNAFFIRQLKPACRPIAHSDIISPVDGYVSEIGLIQEGQVLQAKGRHYTVHELLAGHDMLSAPFRSGLFATLYLSPQDYHRVHMPMDATLKEMIYVPGQLFSVQPATARMVPNLFARNERLVVFFDTPHGPMAMVLVGAAIVGAIGTAWHGDLKRQKTPYHFDYQSSDAQPITLKQAAEMGYFKLGSTVILLFADQHRLAWESNLAPGDKIRFGQALGSAKIKQ